jgi:tRNA (guanine37-N1)-methyltransferase
MIRFHIVTLFPNLIENYFSDSILSKAIKQKKIKVSFYNPRKFVKGKYKKVWPDGNISLMVDDRPYGGGPGMVLRAEPLIDAVLHIKKNINKRKSTKTKIIITSAGGKKFDTVYSKNVVKKFTDIILICGRYEGIDERVCDILKAENISIGDYILTGGELASLIIVDSMSRQVSGVLGKFESLEEERVSSHKVYTRPEIIVFKNKKYKVPKVLLNGNHKEIEKWKIEK